MYNEIERLAIERTKEMWTWLRDNPPSECDYLTTVYEEDHTGDDHKFCWPGAKDIDLENVSHECFLCDLYNGLHNKAEDRCIKCPLSNRKRSKQMKYTTCFARKYGINYYDWVAGLIVEDENDYENPITEEQEREFAHWIVIQCTKALK